MAGIKLEILSVRLISGFGDDYGLDRKGEWSLSAIVKPKLGERLELGTGESADVIDWTLNFRVAEPARVEWAIEQTKEVERGIGDRSSGLCGLVHYFPEQSDRRGLDGRDASIVFDIYTPEQVMASMLRFAEGGRFVREIDLEVRGWEYGYAPDGSDKKWLSNAEKRILPVIRVNYELPLDASAGGLEVKTGNECIAVTPVLNEIKKSVRWALWLLAAIAVAIIFGGSR